MQNAAYEEPTTGANGGAREAAAPDDVSPGAEGSSSTKTQTDDSDRKIAAQKIGIDPATGPVTSEDRLKLTDELFYANHPELVTENGRIPLNQANPEHAGLIDEWKAIDNDLKEKYPVSEGLVYGTKVSKEFRRKVVEISDKLNVDPDHLMAIIAFESGGTFSPSVKNAAGSGATGLIQFMPTTAIELGTTTDELSKMSAVSQLDYVYKYFSNKLSDSDSAGLDDLYMAVLLPKAIGKPSSYVLFSQGSTAYSQNMGLDTNNDGRITKAEAAAKVQQTLDLGERYRK